FKIAKHRQIFVAQVAGKGAVVHLPISLRQCRRESGEVKEEVIAAASIFSAGLGQAGRIKAIWIQNARRTGIANWVDRIRTLIEWRCGWVRSRMRQRGVNPEFCWPRRSKEHPGKQPTALHTPREVAAARLQASEWNKECIRRKTTVRAENTAGAL